MEDLETNESVGEFFTVVAPLRKIEIEVHQTAIAVSRNVSIVNERSAKY